ncbi:MAG: DMT family transporter [Halobacteriovoraceae bacterium]|jgi:drug/metabolite transporter (DMT)-like permease|nr:DMT family transporter [Halobacteriovoraceae bacterium]
MLLNSSLLILAAMIWGGGFIATKWTFVDYGPFWSNSIRFIVASLFISPFLIYKFKLKRPWKFYLWPFVCAVVLYLSMQTQTIGLKYTTVAKSGFITTLYAFFTPIILMFYKKHRYQKSYWFLLKLCLLGIALLCDFKFEQFNQGDAWTLLCAILFAIQIIITDKITNDYNSIELNGYICLFVALVSYPVAFFMEGDLIVTPLLTIDNFFPHSTLFGFVILGIFSSNLAFSIQAYAQKTIPPHIVSLIFLLESIFAAIFGYYFLQETLSVLNLFGCALVLFSLILIPKYGKKITLDH